MEYAEFLKSKVQMAQSLGFEIDASEVNPLLAPFQIATVRWAVAGGRRAIFKRFGLGKTFDQIEIVRIVRARAGGMGLIVLPLGVRQEFIRDAEKLATGIDPKFTDDQRAQLRSWQAGRPDRIPKLKFVRSAAECDDPEGIYLTNYETVRDGKLDPELFSVASLDEADCLRGFGGSKTFREFMALFAGDDRRNMHERLRSGGVPYRFVATATPSPNEYVELLAYCAYLGVMDVGQAKTRFFKRNSEKADQLTIHPHKEREFWLWMASWALFVQLPSDLDPSFSDEGYVLPELDVRWHEIPSDHSDAGADMRGQGLMFKHQAIGVVDSAREKRESLPARMAKLQEIRAEDPAAHRVIWHDLEAERHAIEREAPGVVTVYGTQELDEREAAVIAFSDGQIQELAGKPVMLGSGVNFQRHCHWSVFLGIGHKFKDFIQAIHRLQRFLQEHTVRVDLIYTEAEREVRRNLERKWKQDIELRQKMSEIIRTYGLSRIAMAQTLSRAMGVERVEVTGERYTLVNEDCVKETQRMASDSVGLILTSIPFSTQYEYSPNYADFGHTDNNEHFFAQMDYLVPELLRVLQPGRVAAIHVKNRIVPSGMVPGVGFQTEYPFDLDTVACFRRHGFHFIGRKTIVTDVVRENAQTYRLGWTEQCKDGSRMGFGMNEYLLLFRKAPTDGSRGYADVPVVKDKAQYSRARWQLDAHGFTRSSGNRLLQPEDLINLPADEIFKLFKQHSLTQVFDFEHDVALGEALAARGMLPPSFMLLQPQSWHDEVWTDITRMRTLNGAQSAAGREMHLCPMQFDIADRAIAQYSNPGDEVYDCFGGLMTVPYRAIRLGRRGRGCELSPGYFADGVMYCESAAREISMPSLFDFEELRTEAEAA
ncbi:MULTISPECIES: DNA methyltransferase [Variovorax]|uniref:DNA methyltransferase n=1 Tax=Variovorax TaxID=34072 RepID=UPI002857BCB1|nr:DNA methyltransferase [Variovorax sp. 3319]MDR6886113.1 DNA modification methylase [Variovorax sp. 3319]